MKRAARNVDGVACCNWIAEHHRIEILSLECRDQISLGNAGFDSGEDRRAFGGPENMPGLCLAIWLVIFLFGDHVARVKMDRQHMRSVEKLRQQWKMRSFPAFTDHLARILLDQLV